MAAKRWKKLEPPVPTSSLWTCGCRYLDGLDATSRLKADCETADVPVLALSAHVFPPAPEKALAAGCATFLPKPVEPEVLLNQIRLALRRVSQRQTAGAA